MCPTKNENKVDQAAESMEGKLKRNGMKEGEGFGLDPFDSIEWTVNVVWENFVVETITHELHLP